MQDSRPLVGRREVEGSKQFGLEVGGGHGVPAGRHGRFLQLGRQRRWRPQPEQCGREVAAPVVNAVHYGQGLLNGRPFSLTLSAAPLHVNCRCLAAERPAALAGLTGTTQNGTLGGDHLLLHDLFGQGLLSAGMVHCHIRPGHLLPQSHDCLSIAPRRPQ